MNKPEEWRAIPGAIDMEVSNYGHVRELIRDAWGELICTREVNLIIREDTWDATIKYQRGYETKPVHLIEAEAFLENPNKAIGVRHLNGNGTDNRLENLSWRWGGNKNGRMFKAMLKSGITIDAMPKIARINEQRFKDYMHGMMDLTIGEYLKIARVLGVTACWLITGGEYAGDN